MSVARVAVLGGHGKTGRAVCSALADRGVDARPLGRADWPDLASAVAGCEAAYVIAPNLHPDEPAYVASALAALAGAGVERVVYHSVASPYAPAMPHHVGKALSEDLVRRSGLGWTILQPGAYLQNLDPHRSARPALLARRPVRLPRPHRPRSRRGRRPDRARPRGSDVRARDARRDRP